MADVNSAFEAKSLSVYELFNKPGQFFYIPAYQRKYSWGKERITSLLKDIFQGFNRLLDEKESYTFLGSIITVSNISDDSIYPIVKDQKPSQVVSIIDGQQRTTTLLIVSIALHNLLLNKYNPFKDVEPTNVSDWLYEKQSELIGKLTKVYEEDQNYDREPNLRFYPRMTRAFEDCWSKRKGEATYASPIAELLHQYGIHSRNSNEKHKLFSIVNSNQSATIAALKDIRTLLENNIKNSALNNESENENEIDELPLFNKLKNVTLQELLLKAEIPDYIYAYLEGLEDDGKQLKLKEFLIILMFTNYFIDYVALTIVTAKDEKYAFDIFESLNTTGEPLTAFETFKPKVIQDIGVGEYYSSEPELKVFLERIEKILEQSNNEKIKKSLTSDLIITYASLWSHKKMSKKLSDQRQFFRAYEALPIGTNRGDDKFKFVKYMSLTNEFIHYVWTNDCDNYSETYLNVNQKIDDQAKIALAFLRDLKHTIVIPVLARFYIDYAIHDDNGQENLDKSLFIQEFELAIKAVAGFSILWRSSRKGTAGIDNVYRSLMSTDVDCFKALALERKNSISSNSLKRVLKYYLAHAKAVPIRNKNEWLDRVIKLPIYNEPLPLTRIILLAASHQSVKNGVELIKSGRTGVNELLTYEKWMSNNLKTIEHISPQNPSSDDKESINLDSPDDIHKLGNLTLLPQTINSVVGNKDWGQKVKIFNYLLETDVNRLYELEQDLQETLHLTPNQVDILKNMEYLPILHSIVDSYYIQNASKKITTQAIENNSKKIASFAYDELIKWLE